VSTTSDKAKCATVAIGALEVEGFQMPLSAETLERRFDAAFGIERSEAERDALLSQRLQQAETDLDRLSEAYTKLDLLQEANEQLRQQVRELGGEPWQRIETEAIDRKVYQIYYWTFFKGVMTYVANV
jgi:hypothetical protein